MKRVICAVLLALMPLLTAAAAERKIPAAKQKLILQLFEVTDAKDNTTDAIIDILGGRLGVPPILEEQRAEMREEGETMQQMTEQTQMAIYEESEQEQRANRTRNQLRAFGAALTAYFTDNKVYPQGKNIDDLAATLAPKYMFNVPREDAWGRVFQYEASRRWAALSDRQQRDRRQDRVRQWKPADGGGRQLIRR